MDQAMMGMQQPMQQPAQPPMQKPAQPTAPGAAAKHADMYKALVIDGMNAMYGKATRQAFLSAIEQAEDKAQGIAGEVAGIIKLLDEKAGMKLPKEVLIPVGVALIVDALDFLENSGQIEEADDLAQPAVGSFIAMLAEEYRAMDAQRSGQPPAQPGAQPAAQPPAALQQQPMGLMGAM